MARDKQKRGSKTPASHAGAKKRVATKKAAAKKPVAKKAAAKKSAAKPAAAKKITARKSVPIKTARVSKRALLPPLPPPLTSPLKAARSAARHTSRAKAVSRSKVAKTGRGIFEIPACTEVVLRQKLRLAAPYIELWLAKTENVPVEADGLTPEAAFVRIWQWLMLEATLEGGRVVITPDLVEKLFGEEMGRAPAP